MTSPSRKPWYENPVAVGTLLVLMLLLVLSVWIVGVGAAFTALPTG